MNQKSLLLIGISALLLTGCSLNMTPGSSYTTPTTPIDTSTLPRVNTYDLTEQNGSGQKGSVALSETTDGKTEVVLSLTGGTFTQPQPAHIHVGTCPSPGAVKFPLTDVVDGESTTVIDMPLKDVLAAAPDLAINVHKSAAESKVYTACGDLK